MHGGGSSRTDARAAVGGRAALVFGATGVVGYFLLPRLIDAGWTVHAVSRRTAPPSAPGAVRWVRHDLGSGVPALEGPAPAVVFHAAPLWLLPPLVPELAARGVTRIVAFGSTSRFTKEASSSPGARSVARALADAEDELAAACARHGVEWTVFRPTLIYGAGLDRNVSSVARIARRWGVFPLAGDGRGLRQPVHADDLAHACLQAVDEPRTFGRAHDLTGGSTMTYREMVEQVFAAVGRRPRLLRLPAALLGPALRAARALRIVRHLPPDAAERMDVDQRFDSTPACTDFGYAPRPFDAAEVARDTRRERG